MIPYPNSSCVSRLNVAEQDVTRLLSPAQINDVGSHLDVTDLIPGAARQKHADAKGSDRPVLHHGRVAGEPAIRHARRVLALPGDRVPLEIDRDAVIGHDETITAAREIGGELVD